MDVDYVYCNSCGYEDTDIFLSYSRTVANGDLYFCPSCGRETSNIEVGNL